MKQKPLKMRMIRMDDELWEALRKRAAQNNISLLARDILRDYVNKTKPIKEKP